MKNELFVTAGEVAQELGVSKPFAYKLVRQMNEELEEKGFITIAGRVSRKYYEKNSMAWHKRRTKEGGLWRHIKMNSVEHGMYRSIIMTGRGKTAGKSREVSKPKEKLWSGNTISV